MIMVRYCFLSGAVAYRHFSGFGADGIFRVPNFDDSQS